jgi:predicted transposase/invertase (TIGR01784 family)
LTDGNRRDKIIEIINREEGIAMAVDTLVNVTQDEIEYARMTTLLKSELDWQSSIAEAREEGYEKGHEEGHGEGYEKASLENARRMKADNLPVSRISKYTGLSEETIALL